MKFVETFGALRGVSVAVPKRTVKNAGWADAREAEPLTGVSERRIATRGVTQLTLAQAAVEKLPVHSNPVALVYVTQTPTRAMPAPAFDLHRVFGLPPDCLVVPLNYSCAGYVFGLYMAMTLAESLRGDVLLVVGDTTSKICEVGDRATAPLFGDAVSATLVGHEGAMVPFVLGCDGTGNEALSQENDGWLHMTGAEVFRFAMREVPPMIEHLVAIGPMDAILFHQANRFMLRHLVKKCELDPALVPINLERYGNTSSASIPLLLADKFPLAQARSMTVGMAGFGAGWAWGATQLPLDKLQHLSITEVGE